VLNVNRLSQNAFANTYYSAAVRSMLDSWHNFFFVSFDPGGLVSVDKPPIALWVQALSAKLFGFSSLSLLLPSAMAGVLAVAVLYRIVARRFGALAGLASALALAGFPAFVAVARDNNPDPILILLMLLACGAALRAIDTGRLRSIVWCAVLVGLAFNTKMLAAYLVVPGIALAYAICAPGTLRRRLSALVAAALVLAVVSGAWIAAVDLTPASARPWVGSTRTNSELDLAFNYNGLGRVAGQLGGPGRLGSGRLTVRAPFGGGRAGGPRPGFAPLPGAGPPGGSSGPSGAARGGPAGGAGPFGRGGRFGRAGGPGGGAFGGPTGVLRLFSDSFGGQGAWLLPFALLGSLGIALTVRRRRDPRLAALLVLGGWFLTEAAVLSFARGIVHPYYIAALGPGVAAMVGAGAVALAALARRRGWPMALAVLAIGATVAGQVVLSHQERYLRWYVPLLIAGAAVGVAVLVLRRRWAGGAMAAIVSLLLVAPTAFSATTWNSPVNGIFPAAGAQQGPDAAFGRRAGGLPLPPRGGPRGANLPFGGGPPGLDGRQRASSALVRFLRSHRSGTRFQLLTQSSISASPLILQGLKVGAMGGFNGDDPALDAVGLARLVARGEARYVQVGGAFPGRGANTATRAVQRACRAVPSRDWQGQPRANLGPGFGGGGSLRAQALYDCAGRAARIARGS
jgi:4-amino-4-deoxy-L-arabinose transferase-like glycosyltransferase